MGDEKMTGRQEVKGETSLDAFISGADPVSKDKNTPEKAAPRAVGRPPMAVKEVRNKSLQIKLTEAEYAALSEEAGYVPLSTYARIKMQEKGIIGSNPTKVRNPP